MIGAQTNSPDPDEAETPEGTVEAPTEDDSPPRRPRGRPPVAPEKRTRDPQGRPYRVTSFDVAAEAGVSQSTVSRALAGDPVVSEATRQRVRAAAERLRYHIDENAARLRTGRTGTIAVVVISRPDELPGDFNPFYTTLLGAICAASSRAGHETLVSFQDREETLFGRYQEQRKADGLIVIGTNENRPAWDYFARVAQEGAALVCWGGPTDELNWVRNDNAAGARLAVEHLLASGYRRIACIASEVSPQRQFKERYDGYVACMAEAGLTPRLVTIEEGLPRDEQGRRAATALLASGEPFDAIFAACDETALGVLHALRAAGIDVPGDVGVVGFDGIRAGAHATPRLTTIAPDCDAAADILIERLLAVIAGRPGEHQRAPVKLLVRDSTRRPQSA